MGRSLSDAARRLTAACVQLCQLVINYGQRPAIGNNVVHPCPQDVNIRGKPVELPADKGSIREVIELLRLLSRQSQRLGFSFLKRTPTIQIGQRHIRLIKRLDLLHGMTVNRGKTRTQRFMPAHQSANCAAKSCDRQRTLKSNVQVYVIRRPALGHLIEHPKSLLRKGELERMLSRDWSQGRSRLAVGVAHITQEIQNFCFALGQFFAEFMSQNAWRSAHTKASAFTRHGQVHGSQPSQKLPHGLRAVGCRVFNHGPDLQKRVAPCKPFILRPLRLLTEAQQSPPVARHQRTPQPPRSLHSRRTREAGYQCQKRCATSK